MGKIILFYKYVHFEYPKQILKWQYKLCVDLGLKGRIILAEEGINATLGGSDENIDRYIAVMRKDERFADIDFKISAGDTDYFPRLRIVIKNEIVYLGLDPKTITSENGGKHLTPQETHELITHKDNNLVILDARNNYEWRIGKFVDAITPDIDNFRDLPSYIDQNLDLFKDKKVLMYCTGGIRCERASDDMKSKGVAKEVYQILGGIHRYVEQYPDGYFRGKNYVFDDRIGVRVNNDVLSTCDLCPTPCDEYTNCMNAECNKHFIACPTCLTTYANTCCKNCQDLLTQGKVKPRPMRHIVNEPCKTSCSL